MAVIKTEDERSSFNRMAPHWPRTIQEYWRQEEDRQINLPGKLLAEGIRIQSRQERPRPSFGKRKCYGSLSRSQTGLIKLRG